MVNTYSIITLLVIFLSKSRCQPISRNPPSFQTLYKTQIARAVSSCVWLCPALQSNVHVVYWHASNVQMLLESAIQM